MNATSKPAAAFMLAIWLAAPVHAQVAVLHIQVLEGEGAMYSTASRSIRPIVIQVADEVGRPVDGATVAFLLPDEEPSGVFADGLKTDVRRTGRDGRVTLTGIRWGKQPGAIRIRITATLGEARAGAICTVHLAEWAEAVDPSAPAPALKTGGGAKWLLVAAAAAGAVIGGFAARATNGSAEPAAVVGPRVQIGPPTITIGRP
jgi:hypothetical protein